MEDWRKDARHEPIIVDLEALVPKDHLLRKIEKVMDYEWLYERLDPYYCHDNGRPGTDPVVLIKMVLIQHLFGIPSLRQTYREIQVNVAYRWFLGYGLLDNIPHFATVSYAFCKRFPDELTSEIFEHILNKALNNRMLDPSAIFIDGTHIKASANKKKFQKEQVTKAAKVYSGQLRREVNTEREKLGKKPIEDDDDENHPQGGGGSRETVEKTVSTTDPDCGMFVKGEHERQFAYEAHTACDKRGFILGVEVTAGNIHDSVAWDKVYDDVTSKFDVQSGCDTVLQRMRRKYDTARYYESVCLLRTWFPGCAVTTDMIVAFPGETEDEFAQSLAFIRKCGFAEMHIFPYSRRPGTPADKMPGQHGNAVKEARSRAAIAVAEEMSRAYREALVGSVQSVLFESVENGLFTGHAPNYVKVYVPGEGLHNQVRRVRITGLYKDGLTGSLEP